VDRSAHTALPGVRVRHWRMAGLSMSVTWLYTVINDETVRAPYNLRTGVIDWRKAEPWNEPPITPTAPRDFKEQRKHARQI
jgi:hypothetical protein